MWRSGGLEGLGVHELQQCARMLNHARVPHKRPQDLGIQIELTWSIDKIRPGGTRRPLTECARPAAGAGAERQAVQAHRESLATWQRVRNPGKLLAASQRIKTRASYWRRGSGSEPEQPAEQVGEQIPEPRKEVERKHDLMVVARLCDHKVRLRVAAADERVAGSSRRNLDRRLRRRWFRSSPPVLTGGDGSNQRG